MMLNKISGYRKFLEGYDYDPDAIANLVKFPGLYMTNHNSTGWFFYEPNTASFVRVGLDLRYPPTVSRWECYVQDRFYKASGNDVDLNAFINNVMWCEGVRQKALSVDGYGYLETYARDFETFIRTVHTAMEQEGTAILLNNHTHILYNGNFHAIDMISPGHYESGEITDGTLEEVVQRILRKGNGYAE